jgi:hypothetical protein
MLEEDVDDHTLGGRQENLLDEALVLVVSAVSADELHASPWQRHVEDASVGGVGEVEANDLPRSRLRSSSLRRIHVSKRPTRRGVTLTLNPATFCPDENHPASEQLAVDVW